MQKIYLPGLNGIRAIAALAVVIAHINNRLDYFSLGKPALWDLAGFGVTMFFTLSGFLITYLLLKEIEKTGTIDVKKFYIRRILRIWPLYYTYILIVVLIEGIDTIHWSILFYLLILPNLRNSFKGLFDISVGAKATTLGMLGHYWSLGVEEQFYAFWPWIVKKTKQLFWVLLFIPVAYITLKLGLRIFKAHENILVFVNYTRFGCMALGGLGAYLYFHHAKKMQFINKWYIEILAWLFFVIVALNKFHITSIIDHEILSIFTLIIIFNQVNNTNKKVSLENKYFDFLGKISFGIYVYHPLVIYLMSLFLKDILVDSLYLKLILIYTSVVTITIVIAYFSYEKFEKRFLKIKHNYMVVDSASNKKDAIR